MHSINEYFTMKVSPIQGKNNEMKNFFIDYKQVFYSGYLFIHSVSHLHETGGNYYTFYLSRFH